MSQRIQGADIERAERIMAKSYQMTRGTSANQKVIHDRARVDPEALDALIKHHKVLLFNPAGGYLAEIDPRHEAPIITMLLHFFALGAISQRVSDRREDVT